MAAVRLCPSCLHELSSHHKDSCSRVMLPSKLQVQMKQLKHSLVASRQPCTPVSSSTRALTCCPAGAKQTAQAQTLSSDLLLQAP